MSKLEGLLEELGAPEYLEEAVARRSMLKKAFKVKNGDIVPNGTPVEVSFIPGNNRLCSIAAEYTGKSGRNYRTEPLKTNVLYLHKYVKGFGKPPTMRTLEKWSDDGVAKSVTGKRVEPDGHGPDGSPSWMLVLGYI